MQQVCRLRQVAATGLDACSKAADEQAGNPVGAEMLDQAFRKSLATRAPGPEERQPRGAQPARALRNIGPGGQEYKLVETGQADRLVLPSSRIRRTNTLETTEICSSDKR